MKLFGELRLLIGTFFKLQGSLGVAVLFGGLSLVFLFQNCAPGKIKGGTLDSSLNSLAAICGYPEPTIKNDFAVPSGTVDGLTPGSSVQGYAMNSVYNIPGGCGTPVTRKCQLNGQWDGAVPLYKSCVQQCKHPDPKVGAVNPGAKIVTFRSANAETKPICDQNTITSTCDGKTGQFSPAPGFLECMYGTSCKYPSSPDYADPTPPGEPGITSVTGFTFPNRTYPDQCGAQTKKSCGLDGLWPAGIPLYKKCDQRCIEPGSDPLMKPSTYATGTQLNYYTRPAGSQIECDSALKSSKCNIGAPIEGTWNPVVPKNWYLQCVVVNEPKILAFTANPNSIAPGQPSVLGWSVSGATEIEIKDGGGKSITVATGTAAVSGSVMVSPTGAATTYTLYATFTKNGFTSTAATSTQTVKVEKCIDPFDPLKIYASGQAITTYKADHGTTVDCSATVVSTCNANTALPGKFSPTPLYQMCTLVNPPTIDFLTTTNDNISSGDTTYLIWKVSNSTEVILEDGKGKSWTVNPVESMYAVTPGSDTNYTLKATFSSGSFKSSVTSASQFINIKGK